MNAARTMMAALLVERGKVILDEAQARVDHADADVHARRVTLASLAVGPGFNPTEFDMAARALVRAADALDSAMAEWSQATDEHIAARAALRGAR